MANYKQFSQTGKTTAKAVGAVVCLLALLQPSQALAGESLQLGVYYHDPDDTALKLKNVKSGLVCSEDGEPRQVCEKAIKIYITGDETCDWSPDTEYPCTRFGFEFDYEGATPGSTIDCEIQRRDPMGRRTSGTRRHELESASGHIFYPTFRTYAPVEERSILSEVHECSYEGQRLASIEYIIYYEPELSSTEDGKASADRPAFYEVPVACDTPFFPAGVAAGLLAAPAKPSAANEHVPVLSSQCYYSGRGVSGRQTGMVFKFMLSDMFNVDKVPMVQLRFNATFANGGAELKEVRKDVGDMAFVFEKGERTTLMVITGFAGRDDFAGRPTELIATYYLDRPTISAAARLDMLLPLAHEHLLELARRASH